VKHLKSCEARFRSGDQDCTCNDPVNHPSHYTRGKIEVLDFIEDQKLGFHLAQVIKYVCRAGYKDPGTYKQDLEKAAFYLKRAIDNYDKQPITAVRPLTADM